MPLADSEPEAGPSSAPAPAAPVFKKRTRPAGKVVSRPTAVLEEGTPEGSASPSGRQAGEAAGGLRQDAQGSGDEDDDDAEVSIADLIALRQLQKKPVGIELNKLNKGLKKKKKKKQDKPKGAQTEEERWKEQMERGGLVRPGSMKEEAADEDDDVEEDSVARSRRLVRQDNFQGETNVIDVDKHMMAYIEEEMRKRRAAAGTGDDPTASAPAASDVQAVLSNPEDELYKVAEKYTRLQQEARNAASANRLIADRSRPDDEDGEGSVGLSSAMLSGIPEVELGMESRLKNIEATEKAKRAMMDAKKQAGSHSSSALDGAGAGLGSNNTRFWRPTSHAVSDAHALAAARGQTGGDGGNAGTQQGFNQRKRQDRPQMATDDLVLQRFKKRELNQLKR